KPMSPHLAQAKGKANDKPWKGPSSGTPDFPSHRPDRWTFHLLQRGRPERRANPAVVARPSLFVADVRAAVRPAVRPLSPRRAGLSGLRAQRLAGPGKFRLPVR